MEDKDKFAAHVEDTEAGEMDEFTEQRKRIMEIKIAEKEKNDASGGKFGSHLRELEPRELTENAFKLFEKADEYFQSIYGKGNLNWWVVDFDETEFYESIPKMSQAELERHQDSIDALSYPNRDFLRGAPSKDDEILIAGIQNKLQPVLFAVQIALRKLK